MSHSFNYSMDDDPFTPGVTSESHEVRLRDPPSTTARQSSRQSGEWSTSTRLSTGSTSGSSRRETTLPPTRIGVLKPEDTLKVDALKLVKPEQSPLSITAKETLSVLEKQKQAQKETRTYKNADDEDIDWETKLSSWKNRRKSSYHSKALEVGDDDADDSSNAKKSKTYKELMDQKEKRSNGHSKYTYDDQESPAVVERSLPTASSKYETQPTKTDTKYGDLPKQSAPSSGRVPAKESSAAESNSTSRYNISDTSDREPRASSTRTSGYGTEVGYVPRSTRSGVVPAKDSDVESSSTSRHNFTEAPAKASDDESPPPPTSRPTPEHVSEVGQGTRSSHLSDRSATERETERQKPYEITLDLQVQSTKRATDPLDQLQKKTSTESVRPLTTDLEVNRTSSQAPSRQKSENYTAVKTTSAFEVQMREKPKGSQPQARPSSYAYTPSTRQPDTFLKPDIKRAPAKVEVTARLPTESSSKRNSLTSGQLERAMNPKLTDNANRDRRAKSTFEMNLEKTTRSDFKPPQKPVGDGSSSSRFKQTLSMFQTKESEGGNTGPVRALPPSLATQRSVGRLSRLPGQDVKPSHSVVEMRRGSDAERRYPATTETSSYKTDAARLRGFSRSVQGLDMYRSDISIPDARNTSPQSDYLSRDRNDRYGSREFGKAEVSDSKSLETSSSRAHSSDEERERTPRSGKNSADVEKTLESRESRGFSQFGLEADKKETEPRKRYDANGTSESAGVGVKTSYSSRETSDSDPKGISVTRYSSSSHDIGVPDRSSTSVSGGSYSTSTKTTDWDKKPGSSIGRDDNQRTTVTRDEEIRIRTNKTDDDTRASRGSESLKLNEPKDLYAYKHRSPLMDESVIGSRDTGRQATKHDESTRRQDDKYPATSLKTDPAARYDIKESYGREEYKKTDTAPHRLPYHEPEKSASYQPEKVNQQTSISDIFSKRSSAAVVRGKSTVEEPEPLSVSSSVGPKGKSAAERQMARRLEAAVDDTIKEFQHDADRGTARTKDTDGIVGDITVAKIKHDQDEPVRRTDYDVTSVTRTSRDPYSSSRRHYGLERGEAEPVSDKITTELEEPLSHRKITLRETKQEEKSSHQQPAFEVNFSVSEVDKPRRSGEDKVDKGNVERVAVEKEKHEEKGVHHQPSAFEVNFSVSELEKQRRLGENKTGKEKEKHDESAELLRINDSLVVKAPKEEKRLTEDQKTVLVIEERRINQDEKIPFGDHKNAAEDKKTSYQPHDSFHRPEVKMGSGGKHGVDTETTLEKTTPIGDWESPKGHQNEFQIEIDTRGLFPERTSTEKRMPAVALSTEPKTLHSSLQQELIIEFPESKSKESTKRAPVKEATDDDFYFGMTGGTSEKTVQPKKTADKPAEIMVEIPMPLENKLSRIDRLSSQEHRLSPEEHKMPPEEHKLPSHDHKLPSHEHKLPTEEHKLLSQEPKTELKAPSKEHKFPTMEHTLSPLPSPENKPRPEEHKIPSLDHKLPPHEPKLPSYEPKLPPLEPKTSSKEHNWQSQERTFPPPGHKPPSYEQVISLSREERKSPPKEPKTPSTEHKLPFEEDKLPSLEHRLSPIPSQEHKTRSEEHKTRSEEHKIPSEQQKLPPQERRPLPKEEKPSPPQKRDAEIDLVLDLDSHTAAVQPTAAKNLSSPDKVIIAELDKLLDGPRFDMNSNIPTDTKQRPSPPPRSTMILQDDLHHPSTSDPSPEKTTQKTTVAATPVDKKGVPDEPNGFLASSALDRGDPVTEVDPKPSSVPKKKPPPPPPKTKPKPNAPKVSDEKPAEKPVEKDDWGFLESSERLDVSANKDKCRLLITAPMGSKRRPKSVMFPLVETTDPFSLGMTTDQNGPSKMEDDDEPRRKLDGVDGDPAPLPVDLPPATRMKSKGVRPVSYMEELNSSLFKKKSLETTTPSDDEDVESKPPSSKHYKMDDITEVSGEQSKTTVHSSSSIRKRKDEEDGEAEGQARQLESPEAEKVRPRAQVKIPGLMDELNISFKKKRPENVQESREEEKTPERKPVSVEVATGDLLNFSDDKDDDIVGGDAPPPPLPNAPPPLPNWSAFPGSPSSDPLIGLPPGPPPGPPSGPPSGAPSGPLLDLSFSDDEPGQIHFRTTGSSVDHSNSPGDGKRGNAFQTSASDDMDISFA